MKHTIIILVCCLISAGILWGQTGSPQTPPTTSTTKATTTAKTGTATTHAKTATTAKPGASTTTAKTTSTTPAKTGTGTTAASKTATAPKTATPTTTLHKAPAVTAAHTTTAAIKAPIAPTWITTGSGLKYQDTVVGKGAQPKAGDDILVNYTGKFLDGKVFDSSLSPGRTPFELHLGRGEVIPGWDEGLATMHVGGKRKLIIPPGLAYGAAGAGGVIPPNATLTFDVELLKIN
jgi:peptidylprolyl isomerase